MRASVFICMISVSLLLVTTSMAQQTPQFSQYMFNPLALNPGYAGMDESLSLTFINRQQWSGIENAPRTQSLAAHTLSKRGRVGVGLVLINDRIGIHQRQHISANYAYHIKTGEQSSLSMGLLAGIDILRSDYASLLSTGISDPLLNNAAVSKNYLDIGTGLYFKSPRFHAGLSVPDLLPKKVTVSDSLSVNLRTANYLLFTKFIIPVGAKWAIEPSTLIKYLPGVPVSYDVNLNIDYQGLLTAGVSYRASADAYFLLRAKITPQFHVGYSYDYPLGINSDFAAASHEVMLHYRFQYFKSQVASPR